MLREGVYTAEPLKGMIKMPLGVPFVQQIDGWKEKKVTVAALHTSDSLAAFGCGPWLKQLEDRVLALTFGSNPHHSELCCIPALTSLGLKPNDRSDKSIKPGTHFSLGATIGKGEGQGVFLPAVQTATPEAREHIRDLLQSLHEIQQMCPVQL